MPRPCSWWAALGASLRLPSMICRGDLEAGAATSGRRRDFSGLLTKAASGAKQVLLQRLELSHWFTADVFCVVLDGGRLMRRGPPLRSPA